MHQTSERIQFKSAGATRGQPAIVCEHCNDSGEIALRNRSPMSYVGPGPVPEDARGVTPSPCFECGARFHLVREA